LYLTYLRPNRTDQDIFSATMSGKMHIGPSEYAKERHIAARNTITADTHFPF